MSNRFSPFAPEQDIRTVGRILFLGSKTRLFPQTPIRKESIKKNLSLHLSVTLTLLFCLLVPPRSILAESASTHFSQGSGHLKRGELEEAVIAFTETIARKADHGEAYNNRGLAHFWQGRYTEAKIDFLKAMQSNPNDEVAPNNLAILFCKQGDYDLALTYLNTALALCDETSASRADILVNLGFVYAMKGLGQHSRKAYVNAIAIRQGLEPLHGSSSQGVEIGTRRIDHLSGGNAVTLRFYQE